MSNWVKAESIEQVVEAHVGTRIIIEDVEYRVDGCGGYAESPRPLWLSGDDGSRLGTSFENVNAKVADGRATLWIEQPECAHAHTGDPCQGPVEYRFVSDLRAKPLCIAHQDRILKARERAAIYQPPCPPSDFDFLDAGEYWSEDDY